ncbi:MAG: alpha/beta fold hydrolase [Pseudomonadota bacterium]|nr:MAG: alpha/beta hydrolase [Pseudomonadota bacterium]
MRRASSFVIAVSALLGVCASSCDAASDGSTEQRSAAPKALVLEPCRIADPIGTSAITAECGTLRVPEDPARPDGRQIGLFVARVPAISRRKQPDPLFVIAGGPGMASSEFFASVAPAFARIQRNRDIVLVDQRGTGRSNALNCGLVDEALWQAHEEVIAAEAERCLTALGTRADVKFYTTSIAVQDLERVRTAFGYERINLYGVSYGTRVAQHFVRRFPDRVRSMILDGVVPPEVALGPDLALHAEAALERILARCERAPECRERFGDPQRIYRELRAQLAEEPIEVVLPDPTTGEMRRLEFTELHLAAALRLATYSADQASLLPLSLYMAQHDHDFVPLAAQFLLTSRSLEEQLAYGMHNAVVCTEDVPFFEVTDEDRARLAQTYLGTAAVDMLLTVCGSWPRGMMDPDLHAPLVSDVPALLLSGGDDPVTPPLYAEQAMKGLSNAVHVSLAGMGHGQVVAPCVDRVMAQFLEQAAPKKLDISCTQRVTPPPFFTSLAGPAP